jgi:DNA-binding response OmpR family regulator
MTRILVLDDEKLIRWSLDKILSQEGYEVDTAADLTDALKLADGRPYELIITDLEICGDQAKMFFTAMRAKQPEGRIVVLTALAKDLAERTLNGIATCAILEKPFTSDEIRSVVKNAVGPKKAPVLI